LWLWTATNFFPSRKRCCEQCCRRRIKVGGQEVTEYYHRGVVAHLIGFPLPVVLDVEMIRPGEGEIVAARRLLGRLLERYERFFDAVEGDALYFEAPLFELCRKHSKHLLAVLKDNNPALLADAKAVLSGPPDLVRQEKERLIRYWDQEAFTSGAAAQPLRVVRTQESWTPRQRIAGQWVAEEKTSNWFWGTSITQEVMPPRQIAQAGHERWSIENRIFNDMSTRWGLDHCFHHDPAAILNFTLILLIAHTLVACFYRLNMKQPLRERFSMIAVATQLLLGLVALRAQDIAWCKGPPAKPPP
jgi:Transposase DDE domain